MHASFTDALGVLCQSHVCSVRCLTQLAGVQNNCMRQSTKCACMVGDCHLGRWPFALLDRIHAYEHTCKYCTHTYTHVHTRVHTYTHTHINHAHTSEHACTPLCPVQEVAHSLGRRARARTPTHPCFRILGVALQFGQPPSKAVLTQGVALRGQAYPQGGFPHQGAPSVGGHIPGWDPSDPFSQGSLLHHPHHSALRPPCWAASWQRTPRSAGQVGSVGRDSNALKGEVRIRLHFSGNPVDRDVPCSRRPGHRPHMLTPARTQCLPRHSPHMLTPERTQCLPRHSPTVRRLNEVKRNAHSEGRLQEAGTLLQQAKHAQCWRDVVLVSKDWHHTVPLPVLLTRPSSQRCPRAAAMSHCPCPRHA